MRYLLIMLLGCVPLFAGAVDFDSATRYLPLGQVMQVFEDRDGSASITQVSSPAFASRFRQHREDVLNAGYSTSVFWLKIDLRNISPPTAPSRQWLLELAYPPLDHRISICLMAMAVIVWFSAQAMPCPMPAGRSARTTIYSSCL